MKANIFGFQLTHSYNVPRKKKVYLNTCIFSVLNSNILEMYVFNLKKKFLHK